MAAYESAYDPHPRIPQPETLGRWNPPMSNPELSGEMAANLWRAAIARAGQDPNILMQMLTGVYNNGQR